MLGRMRSLALVVLVALSGGCASTPRWTLDEPDVMADDMRSLGAEPKERDPSLYWDAIHQSSFYLIEQSLDLPRQYRKLTGRMHEAVNADVFGNVPNSSWFTNRLGAEPMTRDQIQRGPNRIDGPDMSGPWTITRTKTEGVTPGFFIKDASGEIFVIKFDPAMHPELATGAEMVSTKLFHAFGYNVPENYLVTFDPAILTIKEGLTYKDMRGKTHAFTRELLEEVLTRVALRPDGKIRAIASRLLPGKPVGPFSYKGRRKDDPNDLIPHEHRRELRGLKVFAQLVNHFDTKDHNTLDVLVDDHGSRYIRHYLIDFGSTLGSDGDEPKAPYKGYAYVMDLEQAMVSLFTLGLRRWSWEYADPQGIPAGIGYFESKLFDPPGWKPLHGNPAFDNMTYSDALWACRILSRLTKDDILACVETAEYSDTAATRYLTDAIWERREKIVSYYGGKVSLTDEFSVEDDGQTITIRFNDFGSMEQRVVYHASVDAAGVGEVGISQGADQVVIIPAEVRKRISSAASGRANKPVFELDIIPTSADKERPGVTVFVLLGESASATRIVGIEHH